MNINIINMNIYFELYETDDVLNVVDTKIYQLWMLQTKSLGQTFSFRKKN